MKNSSQNSDIVPEEECHKKVQEIDSLDMNVQKVTWIVRWSTTVLPIEVLIVDSKHPIDIVWLVFFGRRNLPENYETEEELTSMAVEMFARKVSRLDVKSSDFPHTRSMKLWRACSTRWNKCDFCKWSCSNWWTANSLLGKDLLSVAIWQFGRLVCWLEIW